MGHSGGGGQLQLTILCGFMMDGDGTRAVCEMRQRVCGRWEGGEEAGGSVVTRTGRARVELSWLDGTAAEMDKVDAEGRVKESHAIGGFARA